MPLEQKVRHMASIETGRVALQGRCIQHSGEVHERIITPFVECSAELLCVDLLCSDVVHWPIGARAQVHHVQTERSITGIRRVVTGLIGAKGRTPGGTASERRVTRCERVLAMNGKEALEPLEER